MYDLSTVLTEELHKLYSLEESFGSMNKLYKYLHVRCMIVNNTKKITRQTLVHFVLSELNIDIISSKLIYHGESYTVSSVGSDFMDNLEFRADLEGSVDLKLLIKSVYEKGYKNSRKYKDLKEYKTHIQYNRLIELNSQLGISPSASAPIDGFETTNRHNPFKRSLEEVLEANIHAEKISGTTSTAYITEKDLEDYVIQNLDIFEEGLVCIGRQVEVKDGVIDILAKDKNDDIVIIELKIEEAKSIVWQSIHYPAEIRDKYRSNKIRMITLAPTYSEGLLKTLKSLGYVEIYDYEIKVKNKIVDLSINKC